MQFRPFGQTGETRSALGFGCMRLPTADGQIDEALAVRMLRHAIDHGVNYVDTAWFYHGGESERLVGKALQEGYRDKVWLATKMPPGEVKSAADLDRVFDEQRRKTQSDHFDCYLLHAMNRQNWQTMLAADALEWAEKRRQAGDLRYFGFSFHDDFDCFQTIVDGHDRWDFCQVQYNLVDVDNQAGRRGVQYAASKGLGIVIMEPLFGGKLAGEQPPAIMDLWARGGEDRTPTDWALQWLWDQPEISVVLSGMSAMAHVVENLGSAERSAVGSLTDAQRALAEEVRQAYQTLSPIPCTGCNYCQPCEQGVKIPRIFDLYNAGHRFHKPESMQQAYARMGDEQRADACVECGVCESACPQGIAIIDSLKLADEYLTAGA